MADTLDELIPHLRIRLGDTDPLTYRYVDAWLLTALQASVSALSRYWGNKYILDDTLAVVRNTLATGFATFEFPEPTIIQFKDEWIIILMASIIIKSGQLENLAWDLGSWRDAELSYSNIEAGKQKSDSLKRDIEELNRYLKPPIRRPLGTARTSFPEA